MRKAVVLGGATGNLGAALLPRLLGVMRWDVLQWDVRSQEGRWHFVDGGVRDVVSAEEARATAGNAVLGGVVALSGRFAAVPFLEESVHDEMATVNANYGAVTALFREWLPDLQAHGGGRFVTVSTTGVVEPYGGAVSYVASKGAVLALTRALDEEMRETGVRGHCLVCGPMRADVADPGELATTYGEVASAISRLIDGGGAVVGYLPDRS